MDKLPSPAEDRIDALVAAGVPVRVLVAHHLPSVDWLAARIDEKFRLCYFDEAGSVVTEDVSAARLLQRGRDLGWNPLEDEPTESGWPFLFEEAVYHHRNGVHWYASATSRTDEMLPLAFPKSVLEENARRSQAARKRARLALEREEARRAEAADRSARQSHTRRVDRLAARMQADAAALGTSLSDQVAKRRARAWFLRWDRDMATLVASLTARLGETPASNCS